MEQRDKGNVYIMREQMEEISCFIEAGAHFTT